IWGPRRMGDLAFSEMDAVPAESLVGNDSYPPVFRHLCGLERALVPATAHRFAVKRQRERPDKKHTAAGYRQLEADRFELAFIELIAHLFGDEIHVFVFVSITVHSGGQLHVGIAMRANELAFLGSAHCNADQNLLGSNAADVLTEGFTQLVQVSKEPLSSFRKRAGILLHHLSTLLPLGLCRHACRHLRWGKTAEEEVFLGSGLAAVRAVHDFARAKRAPGRRAMETAPAIPQRAQRNVLKSGSRRSEEGAGDKPCSAAG